VDARHEHIGYQKLKLLFNEDIVDACRLHVAAKRYLCWKEPAYLDGLSDASRKSLHLQGGPMNADEAREFESKPHFNLAVRVRRYDDMGKVPDMATPDLRHFRPVLEALVRTA
jgi:predicted HD phosphohydrolase